VDPALNTPPPMAGMENSDMEGMNDEMGDVDMPDEDIDTPDVDNDEMDGDDDAKKEIQKLAGKLSELLHTYNEENGDDEELNKYVKGMINAQTDGSSDDEDEDEDIEIDDMPDDEDEDIDMDNMPDDEDEDIEMDDMPEPKPEKGMKESRRFTKKQIKEEFGEVFKAKNDREEDKLRLNKKINLHNVDDGNPFTPPKFN
jgi:hypothetical protein